MKREQRTVKSHYFGQGEPGDSSEEIEVVTFPEDIEPARASVSLGGTLNTGNYESVKFHVSVSLPCYREEIGAALEEAQNIAETKCGEITRAVRENQ